jgi:hypothetical protein
MAMTRTSLILGPVAGLLLVALTGCNSTTSSVGNMTGGGDPGTGGSGQAATTATGGGAGGGGPALTPDKIDLLLAIDNSRSMADKQAILAAAIADLTHTLVNPTCVDASGDPSQIQPITGADPCPEGSDREHPAINDIHIGVISSSLGGHGADSCAVVGGALSTASNNDAGHLLARLDPEGGGAAPTYEDKGFLAWDPGAILSPPGEADYEDLVDTLKDMVVGVGQIGCGYESQLESWYRFLVDPAPYQTITVGPSMEATPQGIDQVLLAERAAFLRPDSMLVIVMLSDENDCSTRESGQYFLSNQVLLNGAPFHLPKARAVCATDPGSACCYSCAQAPGVDENGDPCPDDPSCADGGGIAQHDDQSDSANLRCFDQKRRFGIDFLYPVDRYVQALSSPIIPDRDGNLLDNPLFTDLDPSDDNDAIRDPGLVVLAGLVGVPWQDVARDPSDLKQGFLTSAELAQSGRWDVILGDPASYLAPQDPHMVESMLPRSGTNPVTGDTIAPVGSPAGADPIHGHEYSIPAKDDLQYACVMELPTPRDCADGSEPSCDCQDPANDNPLCEVDPATGDRTLQVRAKAYPGLRQLSVLEGLGDQGVVGSICVSQIDNPAQADYGYRPAAQAILARIKSRL